MNQDGCLPTHFYLKVNDIVTHSHNSITNISLLVWCVNNVMFDSGKMYSNPPGIRPWEVMEVYMVNA